jgi:hypothetical protein
MRIPGHQNLVEIPGPVLTYLDEVLKIIGENQVVRNPGVLEAEMMESRSPAPVAV